MRGPGLSEEEAKKVRRDTLRMVIVAVPLAWVILMIIFYAFDIPLPGGKP